MIDILIVVSLFPLGAVLGYAFRGAIHKELAALETKLLAELAKLHLVNPPKA